MLRTLQTLITIVCIATLGRQVLPAQAKDSAQSHGVPPLHQTRRPATRSYVGFDKNHYPGDDLLAALHQRFAFISYWLNTPPGASTNDWLGKRSVVRDSGFGFVVVFNGRLYAELKGQDAAALGRADAAAAVAAASREGFPARTVLFLDQEEGGHLLPDQAAYIYAWIGAIQSSAYRAGVYCSAIPVPSPSNDTPAGTTALDIASHYQHGATAPALWVANDQCPPAPGCVVPPRPPAPSMSGIPQAAIWQYAESPRRPEYTAGCAATYSTDNACHAPGMPASLAQSFHTVIDLDSANSPDPSHGR